MLTCERNPHRKNQTFILIGGREIKFSLTCHAFGSPLVVINTPHHEDDTGEDSKGQGVGEMFVH